MAHKLQALGKCQIYEAIEMTETYIRLMDSGGDNTELARESTLVSIADLEMGLVSKISPCKVWHASCKKPNVSKILDWLVI
jgi:hypothetical protein